MKFYIVFIGLLIVAKAPAEETNAVFLPVDSHVYFGEQTKANAHAMAVEAAKHSPESRPVELDPEGHWGEVAGGFQMSIRLSTNNFVARAPIQAVVLVRNVTTNSLKLFLPQYSVIQFAVTDEQGDSLPRTPTKNLMFSGPVALNVPVRRQIRYEFGLDKTFDLKTPGTYTVVAKRLVQTELGGKRVELSSAAATLQIVAAK